MLIPMSVEMISAALISHYYFDIPFIVAFSLGISLCSVGTSLILPVHQALL